MKLRIYQINLNRDDEDRAFTSLEEIGKERVDRSLYDTVFEGTVEAGDLEDVFRIFNVEHPEGYKGRSLSVSDVVEVIESEGVAAGFYYCDSFGFAKVPFGGRDAEEEKETMRVLVVEPGKTPETRDVGTGLSDHQELVGGYIEAVYPFDDPVALICNEEGKCNGMKPNRAIYGTDGEIADIIFGTFFICGLGDEDFTSLSDGLAEKYAELFAKPEGFVKIGNRVVAVPYDGKEDENAG